MNSLLIAVPASCVYSEAHHNTLLLLSSKETFLNSFFFSLFPFCSFVRSYPFFNDDCDDEFYNNNNKCFFSAAKRSSLC